MGTSVFSNSLIWFGAGISIAEILTGSYFAPLGFSKGIAAILIGHAIGCALFFFTGYIGALSKKSSMETTRISFGKIGITSQGYPTFSKRDENNIPRRIYLHRFVLDYDGDLMVDHINGKPLDCRKSNLRLVTHKQNCQNIHVLNKANTSGYRNVAWYRWKKCWRVNICVDGKRIYKYIKSKDEAIRTAVELRRKLMPYATDC